MPVPTRFTDRGRGAAVVLVHDYLQDHRAWEKQEAALLDAGLRVIAYDRRASAALDALTDDLAALLEHLDLRRAALVAAGAGAAEVIRYLSSRAHRPAARTRVAKAALIAPAPPTPCPVRALAAWRSALRQDRPAAVAAYLDAAFDIETLGGVQVSDQAWQHFFHMALSQGARAAEAGAQLAALDRRREIPDVELPVLLIHGERDRIHPDPHAYDALTTHEHHTIPSAPHALTWTHAGQVGCLLLEHLRA